ncbi:MAG TPA: DUF3375 domain-containing protein [Ktedonobacterales bacterium]|nr:DUF3375 domain-containing protein [Ktedonobacterales bacterium]
MGDLMEYGQLEFDFKHAPSIRLLRSDSAPLIVGFLHQQFKQKQRFTIPYSELVERLEAYLELLHEQQPGPYQRIAPAYLKEWSDEEHRYLRIYTSGRSDDPVVELTADTERALGWVEELYQDPLIGTESRFLHLFGMLEELVYKSTEDPQARLAQLEQQKATLQREIDLIHATGEVARYTPTQLKERFFQACEVARQLLRDFAAVELNFRDIARSVQEEQLKPDMRKGALIGFVLDADDALKSSDQGQSFYAFWEFLLSSSKQEALQHLLATVYALPALQEISRAHPILRRMIGSLIEAGDKIVQSNSRLAEQVRRVLDERHLAESRRVRELITEIKQGAFLLRDTPPAEDTFLQLEGPPEVYLVMEKNLWEPSEAVSMSAQPLPAEETFADALDLAHLYTPLVVDESRLRRRIEHALTLYPQITLARLVELYPIEKGLAEIIAYLSIAFKDTRHHVDETVTESIWLGAVAGADEAVPRRLLVPQILFRRTVHAQ